MASRHRHPGDPWSRATGRGRSYHGGTCRRRCGGTIGGITGMLIGMGIPEYEAKRYEGRIRAGGILSSVHSDNSDWTRKAKDILERTGAQDIASAGDASPDLQKTDKPIKRAG